MTPKNNLAMVADDSPRSLCIVKNFLLDMGYRVLTANNAADALMMIRHGTDIPTVLISDIVMPGNIDGLELGRIVRIENPEIRTILMTGWCSDEKIDFPLLIKPFTHAELTKILMVT